MAKGSSPTTGVVDGESILEDAAKLISYISSNAIEVGPTRSSGWNHVGAVVADAVLQRRQNYLATVRPRVERMIELWPDAETTSGLLTCLQSQDLAEVLQWRSEARLQQFRDIVDVLTESSIETVEELAQELSSPTKREALRDRLRAVKYVGPKTLDYIDILVGLNNTAIDSQIRKIATDAGIARADYAYLHEVVNSAARKSGWKSRELDAALWAARKAL